MPDTLHTQPNESLINHLYRLWMQIILLSSVILLLTHKCLITYCQRVENACCTKCDYGNCWSSLCLIFQYVSGKAHPHIRPRNPPPSRFFRVEILYCIFNNFRPREETKVNETFAIEIDKKSLVTTFARYLRRNALNWCTFCLLWRRKYKFSLSEIREGEWNYVLRNAYPVKKVGSSR